MKREGDVVAVCPVGRQGAFERMRRRGVFRAEYRDVTSICALPPAVRSFPTRSVSVPGKRPLSSPVDEHHVKLPGPFGRSAPA